MGRFTPHCAKTSCFNCSDCCYERVCFFRNWCNCLYHDVEGEELTVFGFVMAEHNKDFVNHCNIPFTKQHWSTWSSQKAFPYSCLGRSFIEANDALASVNNLECWLKKFGTLNHIILHYVSVFERAALQLHCAETNTDTTSLD